MKEIIKKLLPYQLRKTAFHVRRMVIYDYWDSSDYWRSRASCPGQSAVMWQNQEYNRLVRKAQYNILYPYISSLQAGAKILEVCCGIGIVSEMVLSMNPGITIDAVDFPEMIDIARKRVTNKRVHFISVPAENYYNGEYIYEMVISAGSYSAITNIQKLEQAMVNGAKMLKTGGIMLMIDPFHRWSYLARAKYGVNDVIHLLNRYHLRIEHRSGILFWPFRVWLANSRYMGRDMIDRFYIGEKLLSILGRELWSDYKVLVLRKVV